MCGIAGILQLRDAVTPSLGELQAMAAQLRHRGPDGSDTYRNGKAGLAHTRLSIIDIEGGKQPLHNEDKTIWVTFNGEIFNYIELREELVKQGHQFSTHSDTEVLVHLYEQYGDDFVQHLNGQFAFAIWDENRQRLLLVRDRIGIHPLFYSVDNNRLLFASEVKAILPVLSQPPSLNVNSLDQLMTFWSPVSPNTVFDNIFELSPGQMLVVNNGDIAKHRYWDWQFPVDGEYLTDVEETSGTLHELLIDATTLRLRSDVPVGAYLSGGLDSSVLVSLIARYGNVPLRTFSIGFEDTGLDESEYQNLLIDHLGAEHSRVQCRHNNIAEEFTHIVDEYVTRKYGKGEG